MKLPIWRKDDNPRVDWDKLQQMMNIPEKKWHTSMDAIPGDMPYKAAVASYIADLERHMREGNGLVLWGDTRAGKDSIAAIVAREVLQHGCTPYWLEAFDLARVWLAEDGEEYARSRSAHLLVVDDLGREGDAPIRREMLDRAISFRLNRGRTTIVTTNLDAKLIAATYGNKFFFLLDECSLFVQVSGMVWPKAFGDAGRGKDA